jgi:HlyD family secretion protein
MSGTNLGSPQVTPMLAESARLIRASKLVIGLGFIPLLAWLALAPLASAVVATAVVKGEFNRSPVQHKDGGVVREVKVRDGQQVNAGDVLIVLGDVSVDADMQRLDLRVDAERASIARLESEQELLASVRFPDDLARAAAADAALADLLQKEKSLFSARRSSLTDQTALLRSQRTKVAQEIEALRSQIERAGESLRLQQQDLAKNQGLVKSGFVSQTRVTQLEAQVADYGVKLDERRAELAQAEQRTVDIDLRIRGLESAYRQEASDQLKVTLARLGEIQQEQRKTGDAASRQAITAPVAGEVMNLRVTMPGTVIGSRETVAEILPAEQRLVLEARLRPEDIDRITQGQHADIRFDTISRSASAQVDGTVIYVSADRLVDAQSGVPYFVAQVEANAESVDANPGLRLMAGMPAEVFIQGPSRTALQYLFEPISRAAARAGRER